jgi:hypothetical protein
MEAEVRIGLSEIEAIKDARKKAEEILDVEEKLKEAQELLKKLTNNPHKKWYQFWK